MESTKDQLLQAGLVISTELTNPAFTAWTTGSPEVEVCDLLRALVMCFKPTNILEIGTYQGISACYLADGLRELGRGSLDTVDPDNLQVNIAENLFKSLELDSWIKVHRMRSDAYTAPEGRRYQMLFIDGHLPERINDVARFWNDLDDLGLAIIHDFHSNVLDKNPSYGVLDPWAAFMHQIQNLTVTNARGCSIIQKTLTPHF